MCGGTSECAYLGEISILGTFGEIIFNMGSKGAKWSRMAYFGEIRILSEIARRKFKEALKLQSDKLRQIK